MIEPIKILKELRLTEKSNMLSSTFNQYTFEVTHGSNRAQIAEAVEKVFNVKVLRVNILTLQAKMKRSRTRRGAIGRKAHMHKAIVTLKAGHTIELI
jgi:large subunit ribosomal protein L23